MINSSSFFAQSCVGRRIFMGNTVLQPKELLGVLLLKTTASRNKMLRMKWSYGRGMF